MLFVGDCNDCCVPPPEPGQYLCHYWAGLTRSRFYSYHTKLNEIVYTDSTANPLIPGSGDRTETSNAPRVFLGSCPRAVSTPTTYGTAPADDWAAMQTGSYGIIYPGAMNQQEDVTNWHIAPMFSVSPQVCAGGVARYSYSCSDQTITNSIAHIMQAVWTSQTRGMNVNVGGGGGELRTSAAMYTTCGFLFWPLDPSQSMQSEHGIYQFKIYYRTVKPVGVTGVKTPIGTHRRKIDREPDSDCANGTATLAGSVDVEHGTLAITSDVGTEVLQMFLDGTTTHDSTLVPDTSNTALTSTVTAGTGTARGADPNGGYFLGFKPTTLLTGATPWSLGHDGTPSPERFFPFPHTQTFFFIRRYERLRIESNWTLCFLTKVEALDNVGAVVDTYNFS